MSMRGVALVSMGALASVALVGCGGDDSMDDTAGTTPAVQAEATQEAPPEDTPETEETAGGDTPGEIEGTLILGEPITWTEGGFTLTVDAVRVISVDDLSEDAEEDLSEYLDDPQAQSIVGLRVLMVNGTDSEVDWYVGGADTAVVIDGKQAGPFFLGDWGDTIRANAELEQNPYYESRLSVDEIKDAGELIWDAGSPVDAESFETVVDVPELTIPFNY